MNISSSFSSKWKYFPLIISVTIVLILSKSGFRTRISPVLILKTLKVLGSVLVKFHNHAYITTCIR
jgi:hypothetical protein